jgi:hypothetical protein
LFKEIEAMLYDLPTWVIVLGLLFVALAANEAGFRYGLWHQGRESELSKTVSNTLKGSIFALVALLLAFSFSATSNRYDMRQRLVLDQANAIGTVYLRAGLLGEPASSNIRSTLRQYVDVRLEHFRAGYHTEASARLQLEIDGLMNTLWKEVERENSTDPEAVRTSLIVPAANEVIDLSSTRAWANRNHLPDPVLALLLASVVISSLLLGHSSGQAAQRHPGLWLASNVVLALVLYVVLDFDRPKRGMILIDQMPLIELRASLESMSTN